MGLVIAYLLVVMFASASQAVSTLLVGFPIALLLAWAPITLRTRVVGVCAGFAGVAASVAFAYGVFHFVAGREALTLAAFLAATLPLLRLIYIDILLASRVLAARKPILDGVASSGPEAVMRMKEATQTSDVSAIVGEIAGLVLAVIWFVGR